MTYLKTWLGAILVVFGIVRLTGSWLDLPAQRIVPGWPGMLLAVGCMAIGWWLFRTCST